MKQVSQIVLSWFGTLTRLQRFSRPAQLALLLHLIYCFADGISNIFVSVYLWKLEQNIYHVASFYLYQSLSFLLLVTVAGRQIKRFSPTVSIGLGTFCLALFYSLLLLFQEDAITWLPVLGLLQGMGYIFYWTSFHLLSISLTQPAERNLFNGYSEMSGAIARLITPLIAGALITWLSGSRGYTMIFFLSCALFVLTTVISTFSKVPKQPSKPYHIKPILKHSLNPKRKWFWGMQVQFVQGITDGLYLFLPSMIFFLFVKSEWHIGIINSGMALLMLIINFLVGRLLQSQDSNRAIFWGTLFHCCLSIPLFLYPSVTTVILFALGIALSKPVYFIPLMSQLYDFIHQQPEQEENYIEYLTARELALGFGRMVGFLLLFVFIVFFPKVQDALTGYTLLIALLLPLIWILTRRFCPQANPVKRELDMK